MKKLLIIVFILLLFLKSKEELPTPTPQPSPAVIVDTKPKPTLKLVEVPVKARRINEDTLYAKIINTAASPYMQHGRPTSAHETVHDINSELREKKGDRNGFYLTSGKGYVTMEPRIKLSDIRSKVPQSIRGHRYNLYLNNSPGWESQPLYIIDEWSAYIAGAEVYLEDVKLGRLQEKTDQLYGPVEFSFYSLALCMVLEEKDPEFFKNPQFQLFIQELLNQSLRIYEKRGEHSFTSGDLVVQSFRNAEDCKPMREFSKKYFKGVWTNEKE